MQSCGVLLFAISALEAHYPHPPTFLLGMLYNVPIYLWWVTSSASVYSSIVVYPHTFVYTYIHRCVHIMQMWDLHTCIYKRYSEMPVLNFTADMSPLSHLSSDWNLHLHQHLQLQHTLQPSFAFYHTSTSLVPISAPPSLPYQPRGEQYSSLDGLV